MSLTLSNPESVDASALRGPRLSGDRDEVRPRAVQLFVHQRQLEQLLRGPVQQPSSEEQLHPGERREEGERSVRLVLDREVDQDVVRRRPRQLPLLLRVHRFRSSAWRHQLPPLLLPRLSVRRLVVRRFSLRPHRARRRNRLTTTSSAHRRSRPNHDSGSIGRREEGKRKGPRELERNQFDGLGIDEVGVASPSCVKKSCANLESLAVCLSSCHSFVRFVLFFSFVKKYLRWEKKGRRKKKSHSLRIVRDERIDIGGDVLDTFSSPEFCLVAIAAVARAVDRASRNCGAQFI